MEGQLQGGLVQGIGAGLMEEVVYDDDAQLVTGSFMDYAIPKADDVPWIDVALDEHPSVINDLGVKGVGESGCIAPAGVIANAVEDAVADLGVTLTEVPVTSARLYAALGRRRGVPRLASELVQRGVAGGRASACPVPALMARRVAARVRSGAQRAADPSTGPRATPRGWRLARPAPNAERRRRLAMQRGRGAPTCDGRPPAPPRCTNVATSLRVRSAREDRLRDQRRDDVVRHVDHVADA